MIGLLQRVSEASVTVAGQEIAAIGPGILVLVGVEQADTGREAARLAERLCGYRVFADASGRMNLCVAEVDGSVLLVPQFTLAANTHKGMRPSFTSAAPPARGATLFETLADAVRERVPATQLGRFGADMQVASINDGPVTFVLRATQGPVSQTT